MAHIQVGQSTLEQIKNPDYSEWSLDELLAGKLDKKGKRSGRPPVVVPMERIREISRRIYTDEYLQTAQNIKAMADYLRDVALGRVVPDKERIAVCQWWYERLFGREPVKIEIQAERMSQWEQLGVTSAVVVRDAIDVESEEYVHPGEEDPFA